MLFTLKKVIGNMLLPLPLMLLIIGAGLERARPPRGR